MPHRALRRVPRDDEELRDVVLEARRSDTAPSRDLWTAWPRASDRAASCEDCIAIRRAISSRLSFTLPQLAAAGLS